VASTLGLSRETLQYRLAEHNVTLAELVLDVRMNQAIWFLGPGALSVTEFSIAPAYKKVSVRFSNAFHKALGCSPWQWRDSY
jgi:AraC-like DNA-binding protein